MQQVDLVVDLGQLLAQTGLGSIAVDFGHRSARRDALAIGHKVAQRAVPGHIALVEQQHALGIHRVFHRSQKGRFVGVGREQHLHGLIEDSSKKTMATPASVFSAPGSSRFSFSSCILLILS